MLKTTQWTVADMRDFDKIVSEAYDVIFEIQQALFLGNDTILGVRETDSSEYEPIEDSVEFYEALNDYELERIWADLRRRSLIPNEEFIVHIWW